MRAPLEDPRDTGRAPTTVLVVENREPTARELASARVVIRVEATTGAALATVLKDSLGGSAVEIKW